MRKLMMGLAAAGLLLTAAPAAIAQIGVEVGPGGVGVGIGRDRGRDRVYEERRVYRDGRRGDGCRVTVRKRLPNGTVVIRRMNRC
jgi:hypothetical protein